ncbi:MAG: response regulator [Actinomycetota bacterium]
MSGVSVLIVDDHEVVRVGLQTLLGRRKDLSVLGAVGTGAEAVSVAAEKRPDVVVMDVRMPGGSGIEACREIRSLLPDTKVLMLTSYADEDAVLASILAGASGYLLKDTTGQDLAGAIMRVAAGASLLDPAVTGLVLSRLKAERGPSAGALSERERQILELIAEGKTNREIGRALFLAEGTVRNLVSGILAKLGVGTRAEAAARFARRDPGEP